MNAHTKQLIDAALQSAAKQIRNHRYQLVKAACLMEKLQIKFESSDVSLLLKAYEDAEDEINAMRSA